MADSHVLVAGSRSLVADSVVADSHVLVPDSGFLVADSV